MKIKYFITFMLISINANANNLKLTIDGIKAKQIYNYLIGDSIQNEGAMGHTYRKSKNIICSYIEVEMDDKKGRPLLKFDPKRYHCTLYITHEGLTTTNA